MLYGCRKFYCRGRSVPPTRPWRPGYALGLPPRSRWVPHTALGPAATARVPWIPRSPAGGAPGGVSLLAHNDRGASWDLARMSDRRCTPRPAAQPTETAAVPRGGEGSLTELRLAAAVAQATANVSTVAVGVAPGGRSRGGQGGHLSRAVQPERETAERIIRDTCHADPSGSLTAIRTERCQCLSDSPMSTYKHTAV